MMSRRLLPILGALLVFVPGQALAQAWPTKGPIKLVIPFSAGSATDLVPRIIFEQVGKQIGQTFVVENRVGAGGTLGVREVAKADPDGYTLLAHSTSHVVTASTYSNPGYDVRKDFAGVTALVSLPNVLVIPPGKYKSVKDLVDTGKADPNKLNYASAGAGSAAHLNSERLLAAANFKATHVPFKGGPEALNEIMAGRVDFYFVPLPPARSLMEGGKIGALAVSGSTRASALPDVPTTIEAGYPNSNYDFWVGSWFPAKTPKDIVDRLNTEIVKALQDPGVKERLGKLGADPLPMKPADFDAFVLKETDLNAQLVKAAGVQVN
ncbi:MAG TPA: tripartite tricarboxylate transporter substrate-binding protein [Methylomirabilota bacterium]|nr:tripartite tricarboxylate transporter substrate-binding protein [Methylomirabilota bacterium]